jgi:hypothetical protein
MAASLGRIAARQLQELLLNIALDFDLTRPDRLGPGM